MARSSTNDGLSSIQPKIHHNYVVKIKQFQAIHGIRSQGEALETIIDLIPATMWAGKSISRVPLSGKPKAALGKSSAVPGRKTPESSKGISKKGGKT